jgi:hypothetical protein
LAQKREKRIRQRPIASESTKGKKLATGDRDRGVARRRRRG